MEEFIPKLTVMEFFMKFLKLKRDLVSVNWLAEHLSHPKHIVLDSSLKVPVNFNSTI